MRKLSNCLRPSIFAVTVPPPDEASTTVSCIFFCRVSYCDLAFDISSCRLNPPMSCLSLVCIAGCEECMGPAPDEVLMILHNQYICHPERSFRSRSDRKHSRKTPY